MAVAIAGPAANIIFATIVFALVAAIGYTIQTTPARIILASEMEAGSSLEVTPLPNPADVAGLNSGDTILALGGRVIRDYADIQDVVGTNPDTPLALKYQRDGQVYETTITPRLDRSSGAGKIGVYSWVTPTIATVAEGSAAALAGLRSGDTIVSAIGQPIRHSMDLYTILSQKPEKMDLILDRGGEQVATTAILGWDDESGQGLGVSFVTSEREVKVPGFFPALGAGFDEMKSTVVMTVKGLGLLFRGVELFSALSGPARITWMVGKATTESVRQSGAAGLVQVFNFLAFLSVGLFIMNLLPIPALDGGLLIIFIVELFRRRPLKAKTIMRLQLIGTVFIFSIFILATLGDILFFTKL
jgi:regulator of sigma E protease